MFNKNKINKSNSIDLFFDIRNSSVGVGVVEKNEESSLISYTNRKYLSSNKKQDPKTFIESIYKILDEIIEELNKDDISKEKFFKKIDEVYCVLASPWYGNSIENISYEEKNTKTFTKDYLNKKLKNNKTINKNNSVIENEIISIFLNGYNVKDPFNKEFQDVKLSFYKSSINKRIKREIEDKIKSNFKTKKITFHTHPLLLLNVLRSNFYSVNDFSLFDIGAEVTEISIFNDGIYKEFITLPNGFNYLTRDLLEDENSTKNNALSKIKLISEGDILDSKIENKLIKSAEEWFKDFTKIRKDKSEKISHNIFIISDNDFKNPLHKIFNNKKFFSEILKINTEPIIRILDSEHTKDLAIYKDNIQKDPLISMIYNFSTGNKDWFLKKFGNIYRYG